MTKIFNRPAEERSFTIAIARGRFLWLFMAAMLLPFAASLSTTASHSEQFESFAHTDVQFR
jgi:hypothetical protein